MDRNDLKDGVGEQLQPTRRRIVMVLKQHGSLTAAELAKMLGITSMGVRRHLTTLERDKLVEYELVQRGKGRPSFVYRLSAQAENLFPKNYAALANELLGYLGDDAGQEAVAQLFARRGERRLRNARAQLTGLSLADRVAGLARILSNEGYLAEWEQADDGAFYIREHNCAVRDVANVHRAACGSELNFIQSLLQDAKVTRVHHILGGELTCSYRIVGEGPEDASDGRKLT